MNKLGFKFNMFFTLIVKKMGQRVKNIKETSSSKRVLIVTKLLIAPTMISVQGNLFDKAESDNRFFRKLSSIQEQ